MSEFKQLMKSFEATSYWKWLEKEGVPIVEGYGVEDVRELELQPWGRMGGKGAFIYLYGMEGTTGMYVAEIPPGGALEPEKHMYEEVICILAGHGATEVWQDGGKKHAFEWGQWSVFAPPLNCWHRVINGSREPVKFLAVTNAPLVIDMYRNPEFVFNCPSLFPDRFAEEEGYFKETSKRYKKGIHANIWETNFIPDVVSAELDEKKLKGPGWKVTQYEMGGNSLIGHIADWPAGMYNKAHYHGPGAILLILRSEGYTLVWPKEAGFRPYENGRGHDVVEIKWKEGSVISPPGGWFHQHFSAGKEPARQLAIRYGSKIFPIAFKIAGQLQEDGAFIPIQKGGTLIEYEDEDPEIRRRFEYALKRTGAICHMPQFKKAS
jgi:oxalate decarboxylase/phosphoglucose isomerase-like protein (cupin superfamily)